ncbi:Small G protein signaling modulator 1 [Clonorchis sinensis]|uniref:Small G protein signaling modulator 1 n=1 Tax=Clonorchis sinensis TaxID=79923 RepID=A0A8T1MC28_CLOSI|nr:Small G protein signaling modulator 1 [Clonorchis sinensis]
MSFVDSHEKPHVLLEQLKTCSARLMGAASVKNSLSEDSELVTDFCDIVEACLRFGLEKHLFYPEPTTYNLLQNISDKCSEAAHVLKVVDENKRNKALPDAPLKLSHNRISLVRSPLILRRLQGHHRLNSYQSESIIQKEDDANHFLSVIAGPCQVIYLTPTVDDPSWSTVHADELVKRSRFGSTRPSAPFGQCGLRPTEYRPRTPLTDHSLVETHQKRVFMFGCPAHSSSSSVSPNLSDHMDLLYQPKRNTLYYAKNNVRLGDGDENVGYLALCGGPNGPGLRWTSNELLLQATVQTSPQSSPNVVTSATTNGDGKTKEDTTCEKSIPPYDESRHRETQEAGLSVSEASKISNRRHLVSGDVNSSTRPTYININLEKLEYIHIHQDTQGTRIVLIGNDGVQYPTVRFLNSQPSMTDFVSALENALAPGTRLTPVLNSIEGLKTLDVKSKSASSTPGFMRKLVGKARHSDEDSDKNRHKLINFSLFKSDVMEVGAPEVQGSNGHVSDSCPKENRSDTNTDTSTTSQSLSEEVAISTQKQIPKQWPELVYRIIHLPVCASQSEPSDMSSTSMSSLCKNSDSSNRKLNGSIESLSVSLDAIKRKLIANVFYAWLSHMRLMGFVRKHLKCLVMPKSGIECPETSGLTFERWNELFVKLSEEDRKHLDPTAIYQHVFYGGCTPSLRLQVWPYLLGLFSWSMSESEKCEKMQNLRETYETKRSEWMALEHSVQDMKSENDTAYSTLSSESNYNEFGKGLRPPDIEKFVEANLVENDIREQFDRLLETVQKDVVRCDRNHCFFSKDDSKGEENLSILRRVLLTYIWEHLEDGYTQGMCDLIAPILALLRLNNEPADNIEWTTYAYFSHHLKLRLSKLFTFADSNTQMDQNFASLKALVQIMDPGLIDHIQTYGDFTEFYFSYRWFLLDFKREFNYEDIFRIWETLFAAMHHISDRFELFIALALIHLYRDVIIQNRMEFTDVLKFFNERAERHEVGRILDLASQFVSKTQELVNISLDL